MSHLAPGWYILVYHHLSWEDEPHLRYVGGACTPDVFSRHIDSCRHLGELVDIDTGHKRLRDGEIKNPLISFWFDDGGSGVRKYAAPILAEHGLTAGASICSRFMMGEEIPWRCQLSYLMNAGFEEAVRGEMRPAPAPSNLRHATIERFDRVLAERISTLYEQEAPVEDRAAAQALFDDAEGVRVLRQSGWMIANHTASHHPIPPEAGIDAVSAPFDEADACFEQVLGAKTSYWVFPFNKIEPAQLRTVRRTRPAITPVLGGNRANTPESFARTGVLHRIETPNWGSISAPLKQASRNTKRADRHASNQTSITAPAWPRDWVSQPASPIR